MLHMTTAFVTYAAVLLAIPVAAQTPPTERPYRGIFAGGMGQTEQALTVTGSVGGGYDDNVQADQGFGIPAPSPPTAPPQPGIGSTYAALAGGLAYTLTRPKISFGASGASAANHYFQLSDGLITSHSGNVGASFELSRRTQVSTYASIGYQPLYSFGLFPALAEPVPGRAVPIDASFGAIGQSYLNTSAQAGVSQTLSSRSSVSARYTRTRSDFSSDDLDVTTQQVSGTFHRNIARGLNLRLGYGYAFGQYGSSERVRPEAEQPHGHTIDAGIDFDRALSFSRRTRLSFGTGSTALKDFNETRYHITGNARLTHDIGRTWQVALAYNRGGEFVETLREPLFSDSVNFGLGGLVSRRVQFHSNAGAAFGQVGFGELDRGFRNYYGTSGVSFALNRHMALVVDYFLYRYTFDDTVALQPGMPPQLTRQSVRVTLDLWAPLFARGRRPDATR